MGFLDNLTEILHNKEIDRRIEKAKKLMDKERYTEAKAILGEGMYANEPYKFDMNSGHRSSEIEDLYELCDKKEYEQKLPERMKKYEEERRKKNEERRREREAGRHRIKKVIDQDVVKEEPVTESKTVKKRFERERSSLNIATIGRINKDLPAFGIVIANTLNALMGSDNTYSTNNADNLQEEELWGIPSNVVAVAYKTENRQYTHMDFLSIEQCAKEFIGSQVDAAIWVVDGMEGITDFAKEQVALARNTGVDYIIVFVDGPEYRMELEDEIQEVLNKYDYPGFDTPIVFGFINGVLEDPESEWGERILELVEMLDEYVPDPTADRDKTFILSVEDVFKVTGRGTVATGRVEAGVIKVNDRVEIVGFGEKKTAVATGIEMFRVLKDFAEPADNIGLLLRGVEKNEVKRGCVITKPGTAKCCKEFNSVIYFTDSKYFASLTNGSKVNLVIRTAEISGHIIFAEANKNYDGQYVEVNVILSDSIAMETGLRFAVRDERRNVMGFGKVHF